MPRSTIRPGPVLGQGAQEYTTQHENVSLDLRIVRRLESCNTRCAHYFSPLTALQVSQSIGMALEAQECGHFSVDWLAADSRYRSRHNLQTRSLNFYKLYLLQTERDSFRQKGLSVVSAVPFKFWPCDPSCTSIPSETTVSRGT